MRRLTLLILALSLSAFGAAQSSRLSVDISGAKSPAQIYSKTDGAARKYALAAARLTENARLVRKRTRGIGEFTPFSLPMTLVLTQDGKPLQPALSRGTTNSLTIAFDSSGAFVFPSAYQAQLQAVFNSAVSTINAVFGPPSTNGTVFVRNYDATIDDRDAVAGGYFVANNGSGQAEIRFPVYLSPEATAVNFIHTLLLAYLGPDNYAWDAFQEGLVRAATMRIVRTPGAMPNTLDPNLLEAALDNTYDVGPNYDWYNQRALGGPVFIAANLKNTPLPSGGSLGGLYLLRFQMSGSAWQKLLVEYPGFVAALNTQLYSNPSLGSNLSGLVTACQSTLDALAGGSGNTVEGHDFLSWFRRQFILETGQTQGPKLLVEPIAITGGLSGTDFGVFVVQANYFSTALNGDETLLSGTSFPIFWDPAFNRIFPTAQEDRMDIGGGYGSVTPNFPDAQIGPYRTTVDIQVQDQIARVFLPAGAIATASNPTPSDIYGTVENAPLQSGDMLAVAVSWTGSSQAPLPVVNGAFGSVINDASFQNPQKLTVQVVLTHNGTPSTLLTRIVDKGPGPIGLDLRVNSEGTYTFSGGLAAGTSMMGLPIDPFWSLANVDFNLAANQLLLARYNQTKAQYELYPDTESPTIGHGYFVRVPAAQAGFSIDGRTNPNTPTAVALKPGWNMVASPLPESVPPTSVSVIRSTGVPTSYATAAGTDIGLDFFKFSPAAPDAASGVPETGSLVQATSFDPGQAYFVRVIAPEGVTLLFYPSSPGAGPFVATSKPPAQAGWSLKFSLSDGSQSVDAYVGGTNKATRNFDPKFDSLMPPGIGGMQLTLGDSARLFRDVQQLGGRKSFTLHLDGLTPGKTYALDTALMNGPVRFFRLQDSRGGTHRMIPGQTYTFRASAKSQTLTAIFQGAGL